MHGHIEKLGKATVFVVLNCWIICRTKTKWEFLCFSIWKCFWLSEKEEFVECETFVWLLNAKILSCLVLAKCAYIIVLLSTLKSVLQILWFFDLLEIKWQISLRLQRVCSLNAEIKCDTLWILWCWTAFFQKVFGHLFWF